MLHFSIIEFLLVYLVTSDCYPIEEPKKFLLNVKDINLENMQMSSKLKQSQIMAANNVTSLINEKSNLLDQGSKFLDSLRYPPSIFASSNTANRETVHLENESEQSLVEKTLTLPFNDLFANIFNLTPLVDQIKEKDINILVNPTDKNSGVRKIIVDGFRNFSKFLNSAITSAQNLKTILVTNINKQLNRIGGKLIGLE